MTADNPFDAIFAFACRVRDETIHRHSVSVSGEEPEPHFLDYAKSRLAELDRVIVEAEAAAEDSGFGGEDCFVRLDAVADPIRKLICWERDGEQGIDNPDPRFVPENWPSSFPYGSISPYLFYYSRALSESLKWVERMARKVGREQARIAQSPAPPPPEKKQRGGRPSIAKTNPELYALYQYVLSKKKPGAGESSLYRFLKRDAEANALAREANTIITPALVEAALAWGRKNADPEKT